MLRIRSDELLVSLFRSGNEDAFRAIHDRYRPRMLAYTRQMLSGSPQDPEDAVQEVFVRAYSGLRANQRELALRAWLYRIAHNRCIDELRRPHAPVLEAVDAVTPAFNDPIAKVEQRDSLRRLIADVQRLPEQQRSALLMRELGGMAYIDVAGALGVSVPAVKSLLVRARVGLAQASEARDTACAEIRDDLIASHDRGVRTSGLARRHMRDCPGCRAFRSEVRGVSRQFAALAPGLGPLGVIANLLGWGGGGGAAAGGGAMAGTSAAAAGGGAASAGALASAGHVVTILAAAVVATGGAVEIQHTLGTPVTHHHTHHRAIIAAPVRRAADTPDPAPVSSPPAETSPPAFSPAVQQPSVSSTTAPATEATSIKPASPGLRSSSHVTPTDPSSATSSLPVSQTLDPDMMYAQNAPLTPGGSTNGAGGSSAPATGTPGSTGTATLGSATGATGTGTGTATGTGTGTGGTGTATGTGGTTGVPATGGTGTGAGTGGTGGTGGSGGSGGTGGTGGTTTGGTPAGGTGTGGTTTGGTGAGGTGTQTTPTPGTVPVTTGTGSSGTRTGAPATRTSGAHVTRLSGFAARRKK